MAPGDFLGCTAEEVVFGANTTTITFLLVHALARTLEPGDQIILTELDQHANVAPWLLVAADHGLVVRTVPLDPRDGTLDVAGLSVQTAEDRLEFADRNHMPPVVIADPERRLEAALQLPTFEVAGMTLYRRVTLIAERGTIVKVFHPVFPPERNANGVVAWLSGRQATPTAAGSKNADPVAPVAKQ